jgi:hypothetical protein
MPYRGWWRARSNDIYVQNFNLPAAITVTAFLKRGNNSRGIERCKRCGGIQRQRAWRCRKCG